MGTDIHGIFQKKTPTGWKDVPSEYEGKKHYALFMWLGGVRNGFGFGGEKTHEPFTPLSTSRGFPIDFEALDYDKHPIGKNIFSQYETTLCPIQGTEIASFLTLWMGDYGHSWLSGEELLSATPPEEYADDFAYFLNEVKRLQDLHGEIRFVFGFDS